MISRFRSEDPIQADENNLYRYVNNSPLNSVDPSGLEGCQGQCNFDEIEALPPYTPPPPTEKQAEIVQRQATIKKLQELIKSNTSQALREYYKNAINSQMSVIQSIEKEINQEGCTERCLSQSKLGLGDEARDWPVAYKFFYVMQYAYDRNLFSAEAKSRVEAILSIKDDPEAMAQFVAMLAAGFAIKKGVCAAGKGSFVGPLASGTMLGAEVAIALAKLGELMDLLEKSTFKGELCGSAQQVVSLTTDVVSDIGFLEWIKKYICFPAGTAVVTGYAADGALITKPIEEIQVGDEVLARDEFGNTIGPARVVNVMHRKTVQLQIVRVAGISAEVVVDITTTPAHPFWVQEVRDYVCAEDLRPGQHLVDTRGDLHRIVESSTSIQDNKAVDVYNFEVTERHTYFVAPQAAGDNEFAPLAFLVHNASKYRCKKGQKGGDSDLSTPKKASPDYINRIRHEFEKSGGVREKYWKNQYATNKDAYSIQNQALIKQGKAPYGTDGKPMVLHHITPIEYGGTNDYSNLQPMRYTDHSLCPNFGPLHTPPFPK